MDSTHTTPVAPGSAGSARAIPADAARARGLHPGIATIFILIGFASGMLSMWALSRHTGMEPAPASPQRPVNSAHDDAPPSALVVQGTLPPATELPPAPARLEDAIHRATTGPLPAVAEGRFQIRHLHAWNQEHPATLIESGLKLTVLAPHMVAGATVEMNLPDKETWRVGWIQALTGFTAEDHYERGMATWEMPELPYGDSPDPATAPWYDKKNSGQLTGPVSATLEIPFDDNITTDVSWCAPRPRSADAPRDADQANESTPSLRETITEKKFALWLVARCKSDGAFRVLAKIRWQRGYRIAVDTQKPMGERARQMPTATVPPVIESTWDEAAESTLLAHFAEQKHCANPDEAYWWNPLPGEPGHRAVIHLGAKMPLP